MQPGRAWLTLGFSVLVGCSGTFTREGEQGGAGGAAGTGFSAGSGGDFGGSGGSYPLGGKGNAGDTSYGAYGGAQGGYGNVGNASYGGLGAYGGQGGCVSTSPAGPYPVDFVFSSNTPVYVRQDCTPSYDLYGCGPAPILRSAACFVDCNAMDNGCAACGQCANGALRVDPSAPLKDSWGGQIYEYGTLPSGCPCASAANAAPGLYSIVVRAFLSEADALANTNPYVHTVQFELPAPNGLVAVDLGFQPL